VSDPILSEPVVSEAVAPETAAASPVIHLDRDHLERVMCPLYRRSQIDHLRRAVPWVWDGYLARGALTLLTGQWKVGKTTLLAALLARLGKGGTLAGRVVTPGRAIVLTEEWAGPWLLRMAHHDIGDWAQFAFNPFTLPPVPKQWDFLVDDLRQLHRQEKVQLLVLDSLSALLPGQEELNAAAMTNRLRPLRDLAMDGMAMLLLHHPRKGAPAGGQAARGTGALAAAVDVILEFTWAGPPVGFNRRRRLSGWGRFEGTPPEVLLELTADGKDYLVLPPDPAGGPADVVTETLMALLADGPLSAAEAFARWPVGVRRPGFRTLGDRLHGLAAVGRLVQTGAGHRHSPFRYAVTADEPEPEPPGEADG
jgi:hypothetical protein